MQPTTRRTVPVITTDRTGVVSHAGTVLPAELADRIGLTAALYDATDGLQERCSPAPPNVLSSGIMEPSQPFFKPRSATSRSRRRWVRCGGK